MKQPQENYFYETYEEPKRIEEEMSYSLDIKIGSKVIHSFCLSSWICSEPFIRDDKYGLYKSLEFEKVPYTLSLDEQTDLLQTEMVGEVLVLRYEDEIVIINIWSNSVHKLKHSSSKMIASQKSIYVYVGMDKTIVEYDFDANEIDVTKIKGKLIDMNYSDKLYILTSYTKKYHLLSQNGEVESKYLAGLNANETKITHFAMLKNDDLVVCEEGNRLSYIDNTHNVKELIFDKEVSSVQTDCKGRVWILSQNKIFRFKKDIKYKTPKVFYVTFDSYKKDTLWHSLVIDADIPTGTKVEVLIDCDDRPTERHIDTKKFENSSPNYVNTKDILLNNVKGKKLLAKISLYSDSMQEYTPTINSIKSVFDKTSYLEYLPVYYREDSETLYKFLAMFQNVMDEIETTIETIPQMLDLATTDDEFITWLSQWLGLVRDYRWPKEKWREFLINAPALYEKAGTKDGLIKIIELYSGVAPKIKEFDNQTSNPFFFCVIIDADFTPMEVTVIKAIVEEFKPAHTQAKVVIDNSKKENLNLVLDESVLAFSSMIK
jgi:phage tail-like protein